MLSQLKSAVPVGSKIVLTDIQVDIRAGIPSFDIVGLADASIRESKTRILRALDQSGFALKPAKIFCNLSPADIKKSGTHLDLAIAIGILDALDALPPGDPSSFLIVGELNFDGSLAPVSGMLAIILAAQKAGIKRIVFPEKNLSQIPYIPEMELYPIARLLDLLHILEHSPPPFQIPVTSMPTPSYSHDFKNIRGQGVAKRAAEIAVSGFHNLLLVGSPGVGKTMLAKSIPSLFPPMSYEEAIDLNILYSLSPKNKQTGFFIHRPFRSPHHTSSYVAIIGGGNPIFPGEVTLAHRGVLFLDELPEFSRQVLESLREPLEDKCITIARSQQVEQFPSHFLFVGSMNPCRCGYYLHPKKRCTCNGKQIHDYFKKISGPLLERIDIQIFMTDIDFSHIHKEEEDSSTIRKRVERVHRIQAERFDSAEKWNGSMNNEEIEKFCTIGDAERKLLQDLFEKQNLSMRSYHKILRISRTLADMQDSKNIEIPHLLEASRYRNIDEYTSG